MTAHAFNQYMEMYYREHPEYPDNLGSLIQKCYNTPENTARLHVNSISSSPDNIVILRHPMEANSLTKQHSHDYFELMYVSKGSCTQKIGEIPCNLSAGDFCLLNPYITHEIDTDSEETLLYNIMIKQTLFQESFLCMITGNDLISNFFVTSLFTESQQKSFLYFPGAENTVATNHIHALIIELHEKKLGYQKAAENYLALLFMELARTWQNRIDQENYTMMGGNPLSEILAYISQHKQEVRVKYSSAYCEVFHLFLIYGNSKTLFSDSRHKQFIEIILPWQHRRIFSATVRTPFHGGMKLFSCTDQIHFINLISQFPAYPAKCRHWLL